MKSITKKYKRRRGDKKGTKRRRNNKKKTRVNKKEKKIYKQKGGGSLFDKALINEYTDLIKDTYPSKEIKDYNDLYNSGPIDITTTCPTMLQSYLENTLALGDRKIITIDLIYINYPGTNRICSILIAQYNECEEFPNVWSIHLICNNDSAVCKNNATVLLGAYCYCLKQKGFEIGLLELSRSYKNLEGYCSYFKFGFAEPKKLPDFKCKSFSKSSLPMITELATMTIEDIIQTVIQNKKIRAGREIKKPLICQVKDNKTLQETRQTLELNFQKSLQGYKEISQSVFEPPIEHTPIVAPIQTRQVSRTLSSITRGLNNEEEDEDEIDELSSEMYNRL